MLAAAMIVATGCANAPHPADPSQLAMVPIRDQERPALAATDDAPWSPGTESPTPLVPPDAVPLVTVDAPEEAEVQLVDGIGVAQMPGGSIASSFSSPYVVRADGSGEPWRPGSYWTPGPRWTYGGYRSGSYASSASSFRAWSARGR